MTQDLYGSINKIAELPKYFAFGQRYNNKYSKIQTTSTKCQYHAAASKAKWLLLVK
jgi:hypothetical protein